MIDYGAGSDKFKKTERKVSDIAVHGISRRKQSEELYRLINYLQCKTLLELGTSLGLNTLYMAAANPNAKVYSIDACEDLYQYAGALIKSNGTENIILVCDIFDNALPEILKKEQNIDLVYIDGNHSYEATMKYFHEVLTFVNTDSVLIFDDIYWSEGMRKAWLEIQTHPKVKLSIDTYFSGYVFFKESLKEKQTFQFYVSPGKLLPYVFNPQ